MRRLEALEENRQRIQKEIERIREESMSLEELEPKRKRHALFGKMAKTCSSLKEFYVRYKDTFEAFGDELTLFEDSVLIHIQFYGTEFEQYDVVPVEGGIKLSDVVAFDEPCMLLNAVNVKTGKYCV